MASYTKGIIMTKDRPLLEIDKKKERIIFLHKGEIEG